MANEISISALLSFLKGGLADSFTFALTRFTMSGTNYIHRTQTISVAEVALDLASLTTPGFSVFVNRGATHVMQLVSGTGGTVFIALKPGEPALFRWDATITAPYAQAVAFVITAATNANPVKFTAAAHGLTTGDSVTISGFSGGWVGCNGTFTVTVVDVNNFTIPVNSTSFGAMAGSPVFEVANSLEYMILED